jgi:hypothetical protein
MLAALHGGRAWPVLSRHTLIHRNLDSVATTAPPRALVPLSAALNMTGQSD